MVPQFILVSLLLLSVQGEDLAMSTAQVAHLMDNENLVATFFLEFVDDPGKGLRTKFNVY